MSRFSIYWTGSRVGPSGFSTPVWIRTCGDLLYKLRIVEEAERCTEPGEVGQLLRREGLYSSHLTTWRKAARSGSLRGLSKKRGRKPERNPLDEKVRKLERQNARLENELRKAHLIIDVQGKVAGLLGISLDDGTNS